MTEKNSNLEEQQNNNGQKKKIAMMSLGAVCILVVGIFMGILISRYMAKDSGEKKQTAETNDRDYNVEDCIKLGEYDGIQVSLAVSQEDIDSEIESLQEEYTTYEEKSGTVIDGDMIYAEFEGYVNNKRMEDTCGSDYIEIGNGDWLPGFEEAFIGAKTGKKIEFTLSVPENTYGDERIDGKEVTFKAKVQYICGESIVPEYTDDFVQSISSYNTVTEYNDYLRNKLLKENEEDQKEFAWSDVLEDCKVITYPEDMMKEARQEVLQGYYDMADLYGYTHDEIFESFGRKNEQDFVDNDLDELAQDTVKETLVAEAIAKREGIQYSDEEYDKLVEEEYSYNTDTYNNKKDYEETNRSYLRREALAGAVKTWIEEHAEFITG